MYIRPPLSRRCSLLGILGRRIPIIQWNLSNADTIGSIESVLSKEVPTSEASGTFPVGMAMRTHAFEHFGGTF